MGIGTLYATFICTSILSRQVKVHRGTQTDRQTDTQTDRQRHTGRLREIHKLCKRIIMLRIYNIITLNYCYKRIKHNYW